MMTVRKSHERGRTRTSWLDSWHSFSFGKYHDPQYMGFGPLRVINEDIVAGGGGFAPHSHSNMEIVTYVLSGALRHRDSLGTGSTIRPGEIQRMSAGTGITHSEFNASPDEHCHFLQIWIVPSRRGSQPSYEQKAIDSEALANKLVRIASCEPRANEVGLMQDAEIWAARFNCDEEAIHPLQPGRRAWVHVARGEMSVSGELLQAGDGAGITDQEQVRIRAEGLGELLLFDLA